MTSSTCSSCGALVPMRDDFCPSCGMRMLAKPAGVSHTYARAKSSANTSASALSVGQIIGGRYRVEAPISTGAMGEVWRGRDERLQGRPCAIKAVRLGGLPVEEQRELTAWFARESAVLSSLRHPAICDIRDVVDEADAHYLILELIEGRTLADELAARGAPGLPETEVLSWAISLCDALTYLHGHTPPVIFRDLKPQNIMRRPDGRVVLIDFGIARAMAPTGGTAIGTGGYAPPEQYQGLADARSDVYGLAATLHHLLTGRDPSRYPPFTYPSVQTLIPGISPHVDAAIAHALNLAPDDRFASTEAFAAALGGVAVDPVRQPIGSTPISVRPALHGMERLDALVAATRNTATPLPHVLLVGPPPAGMLLRHVAQALAADMGLEIQTANGQHIVKVGDLVAIVTNVQDGQLLYIDDINTLKSVVRSTLHDAMVEGMVDFVIGKGPAARTLRMGLQRFTIIGGVASRRVLTSEVASYFAEHIDASTIGDTWRQRIETIRMQPPQPTAQGQSSGQNGPPTGQDTKALGPTGDVFKTEEDENNNDRLLAEATKAVREYRRASVSLLQRRLSIGYSRAARLLDQLEANGVVGPSEDGLSRIVLDVGKTADVPLPDFSFRDDDDGGLAPAAPLPNFAFDDMDEPSASIPTIVSRGGTPPLPMTQATVRTSTLPVPPVPSRPQAGRWIEVSARLLTWPRLCACCSRPATMDVTASYTRVSGKRVIRTNTRSWQVPVCGTCAEHGRVYSKTRRATARAVAWSVLILVGACMLGAVVGSSGGGINPAFVVVGVIGAVALLIVLLRSAQADRQAAQEMLQDTCCSVGYPVVYQGWNGSVHSFYFRNGVYAQAFADANAKKVL